MTTKTLMICIATGQTVVNLIPVYQFKPDHLMVLASEEMVANAETIVECIKNNLPDCQCEVRTGMPSAHIPEIRAYGLSLLSDIQAEYPLHRKVFNATGGNKLMTLGLFDVLSGNINSTIYLDTAHRRFEVISGDDGNQETISTLSVLDSRKYLQAQGVKVLSVASSADNDQDLRKRAAMTAQLAQYAGDFDRLGLISELNQRVNALIQKKSEGNSYIEYLGSNRCVLRMQETNQIDSETKARWNVFLTGGKDYWEWDAANQELIIKNLTVAKYLSGGWLEEFVYLEARSLNLDDVNLGVQIRAPSGARNEFDVIITHRNDILLIECKTINLKSNRKGASNGPQRAHREAANEIAYKFDSLTDSVKGIFGKRWLVTSTHANIIRDRAQQLSFTVIDASQLKKLKVFLTNWSRIIEN